MEIRGLHLDPARRFLSYPTMIKIIDRACLAGINYLHLHLTDDQGIAFSSLVLNYSGGLTIEEQENLYKYCQSKNIEIIPEIDIPGHTVALRSLLEEKKYNPLDQMGIISEGLLRLEDLPTILKLYEEVYQRFHPSYFHMGGDETRGTSSEYFQKIVDTICDWGKSHSPPLKIIAWEDVLAKIEPPDNLSIQRWKARSYPPIAKKLAILGNNRTIFSNGYYLDTCLDPLTQFRAKIPEGALGCIVCTWGELIGEENIETTIFPSLYLFGYKFLNPLTEESPITVLRREIERINGIIDTTNEWRRRQWVSFKQKDHPRSSASRAKSLPLNRPEDLYPLISNFLINLAIDLYQWMVENIAVPPEKITNYSGVILSAMKNPDEELIKSLWKNKDQIKTNLRRIRLKLENEEQLLYKNGIRMVIRELLRN